MAQILTLAVLATIVFVAGIIVYAFVVVGNIVGGIRGRPLASTDQIITSLEISRAIFLLSCFLSAAWKSLLKKSLTSRVLLQFVHCTSNHSCVWYLSFLSVVFCLKISNYHSVLFQHLKTIISTRVVHLIILSVLISAIQASWNIWISFEVPLNDTVDITFDYTNPKVKLFISWNITPFLINLLAAIPLIVYLYLHIRRMKRDAKVTHLGSYYKAIWFMTVSFFSCAIHISLSINPLYFPLIDVEWTYVILNVFPILHSIFLIFAMKKFKNQLSWIVQQGTKCWATIRGSGTRSSSSDGH